MQKKSKKWSCFHSLLGKMDKDYIGWREAAWWNATPTSSIGRESAGRKVRVRMSILISRALR